jgi:hypothetical protein
MKQGVPTIHYTVVTMNPLCCIDHHHGRVSGYRSVHVEANRGAVGCGRVVTQKRARVATSYNGPDNVFDCFMRTRQAMVHVGIVASLYETSRMRRSQVGLSGCVHKVDVVDFIHKYNQLAAIGHLPIFNK